MPLIDLPLPELLEYPGRNPRPADHDAYWAAALAELDATPPRPELRPSGAIAPRNVEAFDLLFTGVGDARIYAKYLRPRGAGKHPAVLQFHGYAGHTGDWLDKVNHVPGGSDPDGV